VPQAVFSEKLDIQGVLRTTVQRLRVDAGPKGLPEKPIWIDPIFNRGGVIQDFLFFEVFYTLSS
jgi:hypothetical protein